MPDSRPELFVFDIDGTLLTSIFGDGENDLDMMSSGNVGIAMGVMPQK